MDKKNKKIWLVKSPDNKFINISLGARAVVTINISDLLEFLNNPQKDVKQFEDQ
jgi:isopenicillin N synthase-like dioxygenase